MMARLMTDEASGAATGPPDSMSEAGKPPRKPSFKTRQSPGGRGLYRATKVNLSSTNVALIASKFNTIVINNDQGRALLRRLSSNQRKPSSAKDGKIRANVKVKGDGVVKAAIELFEHQDLEKSNKLPLKKTIDSRTKLVVVRKSSSKSSVRAEDLSKSDFSQHVNQLESAKDSLRNHSSENGQVTGSDTTSEVKDLKRKPSLKAKPLLRSSLNSNFSQNHLDRRIEKFSGTDSSIMLPEKIVPNKDVKKPNFNLSERIAQFSKSEAMRVVNNKENNKRLSNKLLVENKKNMSKDNEDQQNKMFALHANSNKSQSLIEQTKDHLAKVLPKDRPPDITIKPTVTSDKNPSLIKDRFNLRDKKALKVFINEVDNDCTLPEQEYAVPDIIKSSSHPKERSDKCQNSSSNTCTYAYLTFPSYDQVDKQENELENAVRYSTSLETKISKSSKAKNSPVKLKSALKPVASESPKLEKKILSLAPDPSKNFEIDQIKPNNSFLWKPPGKMNMITEVPIYDDRPGSEINSTILAETQSRDTMKKIDDDSKNQNSLELDIANSFILEMTEQIDRRFSSSSSQNDDNIPNEVEISNVTENPSFLHRKSSTDDVFLKQVDELPEIRSKPILTRTSKVPPPVSKKPIKLTTEDVPPRLPEKRSKVSGQSDKVEPTPPPIPPSHTKPKLTLTLSEEEWLENCKKFLNLPPPKRQQETKDAAKELQLEQTINTSTPRISSSEQIKSLTDKRFSVSQMDLLKKMDEMNLGNKRNSLPSNGLSEYRSFKENEEEDHYSTIPAFQGNGIEDQDTYEAIGENNYAEIKEYDADEEGGAGENNIYDDVNAQETEQEDHYEAINCALIQGQDSDSSCDQSNSLYGLRPRSLVVTGGNYQGTGGSETSDEWMDLDNSDDQNDSIYILREKDRGRGLIATESWSMKVRRQWNKQAAGGVRISSSSVVYLENSFGEHLFNVDPFTKTRPAAKGLVTLRTNFGLCNIYEAQEATAFLGQEDDSEKSGSRSHKSVDNVDDVQDFDDFDSLSDSSFDETTNPQVQDLAEEKKTQPMSEGIYGLMKQAGQRMRKHWSIGKSLTRMKKNKSVPTNFWFVGAIRSLRTLFSSVPIPTAVNISRRGWSFKSREKPSTTQSTFYLHSNTLSRTEAKTEKKLDPRRMSTASMVARPTSPPPPPPPRNSIYENKRRSEVVTLNDSAGDNEGYSEGQRRLSRNGNSMWYIDTSTDSTSEHGSSQGSDLNLRFADEPLYQFYAATIQEMAMSDMVEDTDGYEEITPSVELPPCALDLVASTHHRSLWCDVPLVRNSGVLDSLSQAQKRLQEAKFEVMTSEASYFKSLTVLDKLFASCPLFSDENILSRKSWDSLSQAQKRLQEAKFEVMTSEASYFKSLTVLDKLFASCPLFSDENILSREERKVLFGTVSSVRKCSEKLLLALQACWQDCILLPGICEIVDQHVKTYREIYVNYCTNQISIDRTLKALKANNSNFSVVLTQLESDSECQSLTLYSFLMLPMQRITRLRLLIETMLSLIDTNDSEHAICQNTLLTLNKCVAECNEGARSQERLEEMVRLSRQLEFPPEICIPILGEGKNRWLVRSGQVTQVNMDAKHTFGRRLSRTGPKFMLFLFTDLFIFTKKKSEDCYNVFDHCQRSLMEVREMNDFPGNNRFLIQVTLLENAEKKTVEMTLSCENETDRQRWLQVLTVPQSEDGETLYEDWDCPQVSVVHSYQASQPDELNLSMGDIIKVLRKSEGWFYGERTRDGEKGWFPGNYTREIASKHVRARNLKQRHRLLQLSADFVQQQKKVKS